MEIHKKMTNVEICELLRAVASAYKIKDESKNKFKIIAYERAADAVEHASSEVKDLFDDNKLKELAGIGPSIAEHLSEIYTIGKSKHFDEVLSDLPPSMFKLMDVSGVGAKSAYKICMEFKSEFKNAKDPLKVLEKLANEGKIANLEGFGEESQKAILKSIKDVTGREIRLLAPYAQEITDEIINWMKKLDSVERIDTLGSLRRKAATVGDIDMAVSTNKPNEALEHFTKYPKATRILEKGKRTSSIIVPGSRQVDLMVETPEAYGALLQHFTGSKHHNIALRKLALKNNLSLSDYGIYNISKGGSKKLNKISTEEEFYKVLGMQWIPPEMREDNGEIELALHGKLPKLIELKDIKGDFHMHSDFDIETSHDLGVTSMEDLVKKANTLGYEYIAFTEHNPSHSKHTASQVIDIIKKKKEYIDKINYSLKSDVKNSVKKVFNSLEIDILPDGKFALPDKALELLDFALVSIHSSFKQSRNEMTKRIINGLSHPKVKIFAHPTARKINEREGIEIDWDQIFAFSKDNGKILEINSSPSRLDLPDVLVKDAKVHGVKLVVSTDSHADSHMDNMKYGINVARRGWLTKDDVINTRTLMEVEKMLS